MATTPNPPFEHVRDSPSLRRHWLDSRIILYPKAHHFRLVGGDSRLGQRYPHSERRLYPLSSRIVSDFCQVYYHKDSGALTLDCHNQASFARVDQERDSGVNSKAEGERIPDCAAFIFDETSEDRPLILCFWVEVKRLDFIDWSLPGAEAAALLILQQAMPQIREQARHAFVHYPGPATYDAFVQVGPFWTHFKFSKDLEEKADARIEDLIRQAGAVVDAGEEFPPVRSSTPPSPVSDSTRPRKRRKMKKVEPATHVSFDDCFPSVSLFNTKIIDFDNERYNPLFLKIIHDILTPHGFRAQPSWLSHVEAPISQEDRGANQSSQVQDFLRSAYERYVNARIAVATGGSRDTSGTYPSAPVRRPTRSRSRHSESTSVSVHVSDHEEEGEAEEAEEEEEEEEEEEAETDEHAKHGLLPADAERDASAPPLSTYSDESDGIGAPNDYDEDDDLYG